MGLKDLLLQEKGRLTNMQAHVMHDLKDVPEGTLRLGKDQGCVQYYHRVPGGSHNGIYIPKSEIELAKQLAQKTYDQKVLKLVEKRLSQFEKILRDYEDDELERIYLTEHSERQKLVKPVEMTYQQKVEAWLSEPYKGKPFKENAPIITTNKGLRVRSKSEKIIADYLDSLEIPYKYECPLYLKPFGYVYPDFTLLSRQTGEEIYWEHEGMMDQPEYASSAVKKIELYEKNGIYLGEKLILTFETSASAISTELIKIKTQRYLL